MKEKNELKEYYERQIQEKLDRASMEKEKEKVYAISIQNQKDY